MAWRWFRGYVPSLCSSQGFFGFSFPAVSQVIGIGVFWLFMPATDARPKVAKIDLIITTNNQGPIRSP